MKLQHLNKLKLTDIEITRLKINLKRNFTYNIIIISLFLNNTVLFFYTILKFITHSQNYLTIYYVIYILLILFHKRFV